MRPADLRWSRLRGGGWRIGADWFARAGLTTTAPAPRGLVDSLDDLAHDAVEPSRVAPSLRVFFDDPASLDLLIDPSWQRPFRRFGRLWHRVARWLGQLCIPVDASTVAVETLALEGARDGRAKVRGVIRRYTDRAATMQVMAYGVVTKGGVGLMSAVFPLPGCNLTGHLRLDEVSRAGEAIDGLRLTSRARPGRDDGTGIWLVAPIGRLPLPMEETLTLWSVSSPARPAECDPARWPGCTFVAVHEQRLLGALLVRHRYWFRPR